MYFYTFTLTFYSVCYYEIKAYLINVQNYVCLRKMFFTHLLQSTFLGRQV